MNYEATLVYSVPLLRVAVFGFWRRSISVGMVVALVLCGVMLAFALAEGDSSWAVGMLGTVFVIGIAFIPTIYFVHYRNSVRRFRDMGSPQATFSAADASFTVSSGAGTSTIPWSSVMEVMKLERCWLLLFSKAQFITVPLEGVSKEMRAFILERITAAGGKVSG